MNAGGVDTKIFEASEKILSSIRESGPKDVYQLSREVGNLSVTGLALHHLVEKQLIEERVDNMPNFTGDPMATVYGLKPGSVPSMRIKSW